MQTIYPYQARFVITGLTNLADELELAEMPQWHTIASAAACFEHLLRGEQPSDLADVVMNLKALNIPNPNYRQFGKFTFLLVDLAIVLLDGIRLGLLEIEPRIKPLKIQPRWIGIDMAKPGKDTTIFRGDCHV